MAQADILFLDLMGQPLRGQFGDTDITIAAYGQRDRTGQAIPRIAGVPRAGELLQAVPGGMKDVFKYQWYIDGGEVVGATMPSFMPMMGMEVWCRLWDSHGYQDTPKQRIYMSHAMDSHNADDDAVLALVPYGDATHVTVASGVWSDPAIWDKAEVPPAGARVVVARGHTVDYDQTSSPRYDWIRVDGAWIWAVDRDTYCLVETVVGTVDSIIQMGSPAVPVPFEHSVTLEFSDRAYRLDADAPTDLDFARDPKLLGRGLISQGEVRVRGAARHPWSFTHDGHALMAGATSAVLKDIDGWQVGDTISILDTRFQSSAVNRQDEERVITAISGNEVFWSAPLAVNHDHWNDAIIRDDLPSVVWNKTNNVVWMSEGGGSTETHRQAHSMIMHMMARCDVAYMECLGMGRTGKNASLDDRAGVIRDGDFWAYDPATQQAGNMGPATAQSNIQSRYPFHLHFVGFQDDETTAKMFAVHANGSPGWGIVHHGCRALMFYCVAYDFAGAGIVSETANETGVWDSCLSASPRMTTGQFVKGLEDGNGGKDGDRARYGYGQFLFGRAMQTNRNVCVGCSTGYAYYHRNDNHQPGVLSVAINLKREHVDMKDLQPWRGEGAFGSYVTDIHWVDYPINHNNSNWAIGCFNAIGITKSDANSRNDSNAQVENLRAHSIVQSGIEYVANYALTNWDLVGTLGGTNNPYPTNTDQRAALGFYRAEQIAIVDCKFDGFHTGLRLFSGELGNITSDTFSDRDPRFIVTNLDTTGCANDVEYITENDSGDVIKTAEEITAYIPGATPDYTSVRTDLPFIVAYFDGNGVTYPGGDPKIGRKYDTLSDFQISLGETDVGQDLRKSWDTAGIPGSDGATVQTLRDYAQAHGYYTWDDGGTIRKVMLGSLTFSDRIHARIEWFLHAVELTGNVSEYTDNGPITLSPNAPEASDFAVTVTEGTSPSFDVLPLAGATDADGDTVVLTDSYVGPDFGLIKINSDTGSITYTPHPNSSGLTDRATLRLSDNKGGYKGVTVTFNIEGAA